MRFSLPFIRTAGVALALLAAPCLALAQAGTASAAQPCTPDACTLQDFENTRQAVETLYGDVLTALDAQERPALREEQNQWRRSARQHCNQQAPLREPASSAHYACMNKQYLERRKALHHWLMHGHGG